MTNESEWKNHFLLLEDFKIFDNYIFNKAHATAYAEMGKIKKEEDDKFIACISAVLKVDHCKYAKSIVHEEDTNVFAALIKAAEEREPHKCHCLTRDLMIRGCKCGGL